MLRGRDGGGGHRFRQPREQRRYSRRRSSLSSFIGGHDSPRDLPGCSTDKSDAPPKRAQGGCLSREIPAPDLGGVKAFLTHQSHRFFSHFESEHLPQPTRWESREKRKSDD
jgi:hypothetical protein